MAAKAPMMVTGTVVAGTSIARKFCRNSMITINTRNPRLDERLVHRVNRLVNEESRIVERRVLESRRKRLAHLRHQTADFICNLKRVGAGKGEDGNVCRLLAAETREDRVLLLAQLDSTNVLDAHDGGGLTGLGGLRASGWLRWQAVGT